VTRFGHLPQETVPRRCHAIMHRQRCGGSSGSRLANRYVHAGRDPSQRGRYAFGGKGFLSSSSTLANCASSRNGGSHHAATVVTYANSSPTKTRVVLAAGAACGLPPVVDPPTQSALAPPGPGFQASLEPTCTFKRKKRWSPGSMASYK